MTLFLGERAISAVADVVKLEDLSAAAVLAAISSAQQRRPTNGPD
jgi:hypothetical protein